MNYLMDLERDPDAKPVSYWRNTSDNAIVRSFIDYAGSTITKKLPVKRHCGRSMSGCMQKNMKTIMMRSAAMGSRFSENGVW